MGEGFLTVTSGSGIWNGEAELLTVVAGNSSPQVSRQGRRKAGDKWPGLAGGLANERFGRWGVES